MNSYLKMAAAFATIATIGFAGYGIKNSDSSEPFNFVEITINNVISNLPDNKQNSAKELLAPILDIVKADSRGLLQSDGTSTNQYEARLKDALEKYSLVSYQAAESPFIPPAKKTQFFCDNTFRFSYKGLVSAGSIERIKIMVEGRVRHISIGEPTKFTSSGKVLEFVYLSYAETQSGPILQYTCSGR